jgi:hypothetical protein
MLVLAAALLAQAVTPFEDTLGNAWLVKVKPGTKLYFYDDIDKAAPRPGRAYVVAGDSLVATGTRGRFTAVTFVGPGGRPREGWVENAGLVRVARPAAIWTGVWKAWDADIEIKPARAGTLRVEGSAVWGGHDPVRVANGGVHVGEFALDVKPLEDRIAFSVESTGDRDPVARPVDAAPEEEFRCRVRLRVLGPYLLARDNGVCGGANVTFTGTYRRR